MYTIQYISQKEIAQIEREWRSLECGEEMTYFQRYEWYKMLIPFTPSRRGIVESIYAVVYKNGRAVLIAPLWIIRKDYLFVNKKGIYFIGRKGCTDYLNFIYERLEESALSFLIDNVAKEYKIRRFFLEQLLENTSSFKYLKNNFSSSISGSETCVHIDLPAEYDIYYTQLSKNSRKTIRGAKNRVQKDGKQIEIRCDDKEADKLWCEEIRANRLAKKNYYVGSFIIKLKTFIYRQLEIQFPEYSPLDVDPHSHLLSLYCDGRLRMFFCYGRDEIHSTISLIHTGIDENYTRYSFGILGLQEFISTLIDDPQIKVLDFLRGGEHYKYSVGGEEHYIHNLEINL